MTTTMKGPLSPERIAELRAHLKACRGVFITADEHGDHYEKTLESLVEHCDWAHGSGHDSDDEINRVTAKRFAGGAR